MKLILSQLSIQDCHREEHHNSYSEPELFRRSDLPEEFGILCPGDCRVVIHPKLGFAF